METPVRLDSRLPGVGTTIFTHINEQAAKHNALNMAQGFPDFLADNRLLERVNYYLQAGRNQYAPTFGELPLREAISAKINRLYQRHYAPESEITVTAGATQALYTVISTCVRADDEVIVFDPAFDSYQPAVQMHGGKLVRLALSDNEFRIDFTRLQSAISARTRLIIINTPHNPSGCVWPAIDLERLAKMLANTNIFVLADEVYEHIIFDDRQHASVARYDGLAERAFLVSSFGKTYHVTGWKIGYVCAPAALMQEFRRMHQYQVFSVSTPMQLALADFMQSNNLGVELAEFYQQKRDTFRAALAGSSLQLQACQGTYFQLLDYSAVSDKSDMDFCQQLICQQQLAAIPLSPFYGNGGATGRKLIRLCFAKGDNVLLRAAEILQTL